MKEGRNKGTQVYMKDSMNEMNECAASASHSY